MHRKGSPIALIRAADHLGRQGSQSEPPFVPPLKPAAAHTATKLAAPRITGAPRTGHPDFTIRTPISPSGPQFHHPNSTSHLPPPPERGGAGRNLPGLAAPLRSTPTAAPSRGAPHGPRTPTRGAAAAQRCADPRGRSAGGAGAARPRGGAVGSRMPAAPGAVKSQGHKSALFFSPQGQGFGPSPSCHRRERTHLPAAVPASQGLGSPAAIFRRGLQRCAGIILLFLPLAPAPLQNLSLTLRKHLEEGWIPGMPAPR